MGAPTTGQEGTVKDFKHPLYIASGGDPQYTLHGGYPFVSGQPTQVINSDIEGDVIRVPAGAVQAGGPDGSMAIVQSGGTEYDLFNVESIASGEIHFGFGRRGDFGDDGLASGVEGGITSAQFLYGLGLIRYAELASGSIPHALFMTVNGWHGRQWPAALGGDLTGQIPTPDADGHIVPKMGQWLYLDLTPTQINALAIPDYAKTILKALHLYGGVVGDTGGATIGFQLESSLNFTYNGGADPLVPYAQSQGVFNTLDTDISRTIYYFTLTDAVLTQAWWRAHLKVMDTSGIAPPPPVDTFDPDTTTPFDQGGGFSDADSVPHTNLRLPNDDYRAYVKVAQTVSGKPWQSDWAYNDFSINVPQPAEPTVTVTAENTEGRIRIRVADPGGGDVSTQ
ncbi:MAG: hypothetical protein ACREMY_06575, partial [bacterium]